MKTIAVAAALAASIIATSVAASANSYVDPNAPFNGYDVFRSFPQGQ